MRNGWKKTHFGDCVTMLSGGTPSKANDSYWKGEIPWVSCKDMKTERIFDAEDHLTEDGAKHGTRMVDSGTVLIVVRGMILANEFPVAIAKRPVTFNQDLKALKCAPGLRDEYLFYWLKAKTYDILGIADEAAHGTKRLQTDRLQILDIEIPPRPVQDAMVSVLSAYDDLIENNTRRIKILEQMAEMVFREWFVDFRFPGHKNVPMVESELGPIPQGWQTGILRDVCDSMDYGYTASASVEPIGPKFLRITDIVPSVIDWHTVPHCSVPDKNADKYFLREGDIVVARTGATTGYAKRLHKRHPTAIFASYLVRLRIRPNFSNHLFGVLVESDEYKRFIQGNWSGAAQPQANAQVLTSIPIVIAPEPLHRQFSALAEPLLALKETLQFKNLNLRTTRDLLLPKLISGELSIDATDGAAAELTEYEEQPA